MRHHTQTRPNPFAMLLDPERILRAVEGSERLNRLQSRICRPLDKSLPAAGTESSAEFDRMVEQSPDDRID